MPNFNGMGPTGAGPMSGRNLGPCGGGQAARRGFGYGAGPRGAGRGFGRGAESPLLLPQHLQWRPTGYRGHYD